MTNMMAREGRDLLAKRSLVSLLLWAAILNLSKCQETSTKPPVTTTPSATVAATISDNNTDLNSTANSTGVLISNDEFVDFTEAPVPLFDGISSENATATTTTESPPATTSSETRDTSPATSTPSAEIESDSTTVAPNLESGDESGGNSTASDGPEDSESEAEDEASEDTKPEVEAEFKPPQNVSQYMDYIERLFHDLRHQITDLFEPHIPQLIRTSQMVQLSGSCSYDMLRMALALRQFEPWALRMIDSSGKVPEGIFEGSFTALGSYDECLQTQFGVSPESEQSNTQRGTSSDSPSGDNQQQQVAPSPTQGKYCLVNISPFLPPKPPADRVERLFQEEANRRNYTKDDQFSRLSPMFYYMKFRIGVCIPSTCMKSDMLSISEALSSSLKLNITVSHCQVKQDTLLTSHQLAGGFIFGLVLTLVISATIIDCYRRKWSQMERRNERIVMLNVVVGDKLTSSLGTNQLGYPIGLFKGTSEHSDLSSSSLSCDQLDCSSTKSSEELLKKHWSWMSFSLLTNFELYFDRKSSPPPKTQVASPDSREPMGEDQQSSQATPIIKCLNGIRVLSLCWVIIANSYITLDPRATKRLTKTREAPKDFLFQMVVQASLAIETFFFLSGVLMSLSFANRLKPKRRSSDTISKESSQVKDAKTTLEDSRKPSYLMKWVHFYVHRYIRMTPATMLVIAFSMFAYRYGDGPLWAEATHKAHQSCSQNWWRHLLHVANFIDTRQMCFIHYWYIAADMQLFLFAPLLMFLLYQRKRLGYWIMSLIGAASVIFVFYTTYARNLPPTLLFYNSDPESRREFGNTIMTKPITHVLPYMVGMVLGKRLVDSMSTTATNKLTSGDLRETIRHKSLTAFLGSTAAMIALVEVFLPYKWNNSHLPTRFLAAVYAALFRFAWSLALAYLVISCRHKRSFKCRDSLGEEAHQRDGSVCSSCQSSSSSSSSSPSLSSQAPLKMQHNRNHHRNHHHHHHQDKFSSASCQDGAASTRVTSPPATNLAPLCMCGSGGNLVNRLLSLSIFTHLSKLSFVAYLIHLPLMSVFIGQTRGLFAFSHTLVVHLALSYLVMTFILSFVLVHIIEFPFLTFERYLFNKWLYGASSSTSSSSLSSSGQLTGAHSTTQKSSGAMRTSSVGIQLADDRRQCNRQQSYDNLDVRFCYNGRKGFSEPAEQHKSPTGHTTKFNERL